MKRTNYAGLIDETYLNQTVTLTGWVQKRRDFGDLIFVDLRDREGIVQLTFNATNADALAVAEKVRSEYVLKITGHVIERAENQINTKIKSGTIEVDVTEAEILSTSKTPPFYIEDDVNANEELKLQYRYLDLRRPEMQKNLRIRSKIMSSAMHFMDTHDFINIETPVLAKSTPEGARDYLVPSRVFPGSFYALPQSPQLFKQLLMGAGFDRYFQIARAFRDEDLRGDRQPEFTQMDVETSFMTADEIRELVNAWVKAMMHDVVDFDLDTAEIPTLTWQESMDRFGTDKPDLRIAYEIKDLSETVKNSEFGVFANAIKGGGVVKALAVPGGADHYSRKDIDKLTKYIERFGAKGLAWMKVAPEGLTGPIAKFFDDEAQAALIASADAQVGDLLLFGAGRADVVSATLDYLRRETAKALDLIDQTNPWAFAWIVDWPLFEYSEDFDRWIAAHHPFTMPNEEDLHYLNDGEDPHKAHAQSYDLVLNGYELGSGSIRIHRMDIQEKMLKALGFTPEKAHEAFGFLLEGMEYGFPPMGGIALGLDRLAMLLAGQENIREVIAFPKNSRATEPMTEAPTRVEGKQLNELGLFVPEAE
ncbi:aspartate--tRNA ligase [Leuconostoc mesenteroides subsp. mesenteroides]|uniref:Aspartate--tRNA ligase n=1 Tax=Leuconostoc mesenteroides subsp. mesenteroides (strain ATCC 8293 / DSM 20343 / BCRC 11652 / CCM 1803 / JCM 6124 / NCDO 523 / NBRC 100496 / NCIMB 8023 / NCTC 12954 / NRRL B-1118 / 37Y) TaxID=203120 RepID=SYD_LEUMM|nr:aspartate--tRNA ligase [Leuconostoc mesenteroides]Q03WL7.1 RecName: Full=Aspartate--tRNA ligase; AltName: Full=Aspartyl-tRNA synthetase; Short=AspRS [Leuconostoc mesenteroides subsp. mesenteroides ATCC 8293]ABJ62405.1 aspartyl-tRNA synthetase [Leuconostoc mesenteroides subsp. mesenteroides ATCC 8293]MCT3042770.1 aspartate--tRNA ligase [Leuconostoc mesenteroides]MDG9747184.1 aspartate--tRNA ligase [Leuconostoc mesenteroides]QHM55757.1 Aspartate--tRNA ligase [Leuconostoc mesenteroides]QQB308